jgi:hypothetical protein
VDASFAYQELRRARAVMPERIDSVRNGVYVLWIDASGFVDLEVQPGLDGVGYVGVAAGSGGLKKRFREEWRRTSARSSHHGSLASHSAKPGSPTPP